MDSVSVVLAALAAGATSAAQDTASQAVKDAYSGLKALVKKRFEKQPHAEMTLAEYENDPGTWQKPLQKSLVEAGADQDEAIVRQAGLLLKLVNPQQASQGKYHVQIGEGKGIVIGDHAHVVQQFYNASAEPQVDLTVAEATYRRQVVNAYKWLNFSGFDTPDSFLTNVPLEEIFVRLTLTVEKVIRELSRSERHESRQQERAIAVQEPIELGQALGNHLLIVGEPGAGKSTLLRWLAVTFAQGRQREFSRVGPSADADRLPVLVELGHLPDRYVKPEGGEIPNWFRFLPEYLRTQMAFTDTPPQLLTQALADGRCLLLFDGLDEIADRQVRARLARSLAELARLSPGNRVIIGSRPAGVSESGGALRPHFRHCQIERFTPQDVQRFFRFWYALDRDLAPEQQRAAADALYTRVQAAPATLQLASTPLLSTLLVLIWRNEGDLPAHRVDLYEYCCRMLIERWEVTHDVIYQGVLASMDWEDHLHLLIYLAYGIHSQERRTTATKEELLPLLAQALQAGGYSNEQVAALREARQFLDAIGLRSGLLQYLGADTFGFPHQIFQEYLVARYIAAQPDPDFIDLVMAHLHEDWWQEVHLLTIAHLGSRNGEANKASALILTILHVYKPPSWLLCSSRNRWCRLIEPGRLLPQVQIERRIAWILAREFEMAIKGFAECVPGGTTAQVRTVLSAQATSFMRHLLYNQDRYAEWTALLDHYDDHQDRSEELKALLILIGQLLPRRGNEAVVSVLREALHDDDLSVRHRAIRALGRMGAGNETAVNTLREALHDAEGGTWALVAETLAKVGMGNEAVADALLKALDDGDKRDLVLYVLGQVGVGNEAVVSALLKALDDTDMTIQWGAVKALGQVGAGNETVVNALLKALHDADGHVQRKAAASLGQVGAGNEVAVSALLEILRNGSWIVRLETTASLSRMGVSKNEVVSALLEALRDDDVAIRGSAAEALGQAGVGSEAVVNALLKALDDAEWIVRQQAAEALGQLGAGNEAVVNALLKALDDRGGFVQIRAVRSLGQVGMDSEAVVDTLLKLWEKALANGNDHDPLPYEVAESLEQVGMGNEAVVSALLKALEEGDWFVRDLAAKVLGQVGAGNQAVLEALLEALHDENGYVRMQATASLEKLDIKDTLQLRRVLLALYSCLYSWESSLQRALPASMRQLLHGRPIPGYRWVPLRKRRARRLRLKRTAFWLGIIAVLLVIGLVATWLLGVLDSNSFPVRFLAVLAGTVAFVAAATQVLGWALHDPWDHT